MNDTTATDSRSGYRLGPLQFADGMSGLNAWTYLYVSLTIMPVILQAQGMSSADAGRYMLFVMAGFAAFTALVMQLGLKRGTPTGLSSRIGLRRVLQIGMQDQPFSPLGYLGGVLVGMGQMSVILSVTGLLGQETPLDVRGSVIGLAGLCGSLGILVTSVAGGFLFDHWRISGPIILVGAANLVAFIFALRVWLRDGRPVKFDPGEARSSETTGIGMH